MFDMLLLTVLDFVATLKVLAGTMNYSKSDSYFTSKLIKAKKRRLQIKHYPVTTFSKYIQRDSNQIPRRFC
jgi:hypothetical protein